MENFLLILGALSTPFMLVLCTILAIAIVSNTSLENIKKSAKEIFNHVMQAIQLSLYVGLCGFVMGQYANLFAVESRGAAILVTCLAFVMIVVFFGKKLQFPIIRENWFK